MNRAPRSWGTCRGYGSLTSVSESWLGDVVGRLALYGLTNSGFVDKVFLQMQSLVPCCVVVSRQMPKVKTLVLTPYYLVSEWVVCSTAVVVVVYGSSWGCGVVLGCFCLVLVLGWLFVVFSSVVSRATHVACLDAPAGVLWGFW